MSSVITTRRREEMLGNSLIVMSLPYHHHQQQQPLRVYNKILLPRFDKRIEVSNSASKANSLDIKIVNKSQRAMLT
jgi:hypothetical protein